MDWREGMLSFCGPGVLSGISLPDWLRLLRAQRREIEVSYLPRIVTITVQSLKTSALGVIERKRYEKSVQKVVVQPPLFVLGHWRSGTTHLHQLLAQDIRFAFPNSYQTAFPRIFLSSESADARLLSFFIPRRRPMDNVDMNLASPQEDEFALCGTCLLSPCMGWVFPSQREKFGKYLTFKGVDALEVVQWKNALLQFVKKVQLRSNRPLILKSPPHTARIRLLLELFPEARFVHIHRNPFRVFQSTRRLFLIMFRWHGLQHPDLDTLDDWILNQYQEMYKAFFDEKNLIPKGRFHEVGFESLDQDPIGEIQKLYQALDLPDFTIVEPELRRYVDSLATYRKNRFTDLSCDLRERIVEKWKGCFEEWGYPFATDV